MAVDKTKAIKLREQGMSYKDVAQELGCSEAWCKINLKSVQKNVGEKNAINHCISLALSLQGITYSEILRSIQSVYSYADTKEQRVEERKAMTRFRNAINKVGGTVIRPYWMQPANAQQSLTSVLQAVDDISVRINDEIEFIRRKYDMNSSYDKSLRTTIIKMLMCSKLPEGIEAYCDHLSSVANKLEDRLCDKGSTFSNSIEYSAEKDIPFEPMFISAIFDECGDIVPEEYLDENYAPLDLDDLYTD